MPVIHFIEFLPEIFPPATRDFKLKTLKPPTNCTVLGHKPHLNLSVSKIDRFIIGPLSSLRNYQSIHPLFKKSNIEIIRLEI